MKKEHSNWTKFLHKLRFKYRVTVLNENTLEESWHIRLSRMSVFLLSSLFIVITFTLLTLLIVYTPFRYYLPGYTGGSDRTAVIGEAMQVDSLLTQMEMQATYLEVLKGIISGDIERDANPGKDTATLRQRAEIMMDKARSEKEFVEKYEEEEKFNLSSLNYGEMENVFVFFKPTNGVISEAFDAREKKYGISILTTTNETVVSVLQGTVILTAFTFNSGWVMQIQHDDNYISVYKNNTQLLKRQGDMVKAGEAIAFTGDSGKSGNHFRFELWKQGKPVNPEDVIIF